ncbi:S9 family peptidase [Urechidicola vernalis]|uniref:Prolyl oligopeptidase family serine peptidase n=1 Tax=Urechidicola vernalis TaxID=3075600 RepID=A0ABU2Y5R2_9FLAO|nr:prolyl oligopeptidase family serine peptidase [Urechidicola sp. P050]MDT0553548.1 prolyl oligopeptidase family serine peptidase [Urechidicola sp. P050]
MNKFLKLSFLVLFISSSLFSQQISKEDYKRAVSYMYANYNNKTAFNLTTNVNWFEDKSGIWFIDYSKNAKTYKTVNFKNGKVTELFDHAKFSQEFSKFTKDTIAFNDISISDVESSKDGIQFKYKNKKYQLDTKKFEFSKVEEEKKEERNEFETKSPDGKWIAFVRDYNLFIKSVDDKEEHQLTTDGKKDYEYATWYGWYDKMEGENGDRPKHFYVDWSPDSKFLKTDVLDFRNAEKMYLLDWSIDSLYKPKLMTYFRGSPGDTSMVHVQPVVFNVEKKKQLDVNLPKQTHINSVTTQWTEKSSELIARIPERGYQKEEVNLIDLNSNTSKNLISEISKTNIDDFRFVQFEGQNKLVFLSQRSGWRQLYECDFVGNIKAITKGDFVINDVKYLDEENGDVYFMASGVDAQMNPYHQQLYKVDVKGKMELLTPEKTHHEVNFSEDGAHFVDAYSTISIPTKTVLRKSKSGRIVVQLTQADISHFTSQGFESPEVFHLIAKDKKTKIYGAFWKPSNFDATKSYPIIDATYTGPHTQRFPKSFNLSFSEQSLAELGFIVVRIDGLGTSGRSKEFLGHSYKNMGKNLEDHVLAIEHLANKHSFINKDKVGIYGHSAGGFDTGRALLAFPDFYKVGVASSADHDFRMEKAWWPEMYMGWPVDESYEAASNITNAKNLKGKLLLVHGGIDENVNPSATFKLAEAFVNADKEFDLLILPSQRHGYTGKARNYFIKKRWNYFVEHLKNENPVWDFSWE